MNIYRAMENNKIQEPTKKQTALSKKTSQSSKKSFHIIGKGSYGCIVYPEINRLNKQPGSRKYISKLQLRDIYATNEIAIGKILQKVPKYQFFFAPVLEHYPITMSSITDNTITECLETNNSIVKEIAKKKVPSFVSNKIQYIGKQTFQRYFLSILIQRSIRVKQSAYVYTSKVSDRRMHQYVSSLLNNHLYLLHTLALLNENGVLHLDIKENNVVHNKENDVFIMIDFGLSVEVADLEPATYVKTSQKPFAFLSEKYQPWCIDIVLMAYIARQITTAGPNSVGDTRRPVSDEKFSSKIPEAGIQEMTRLCSLYISNNRTFQTVLFDEQEKKNYEMRLHAFVQTFKGKTWKEVWQKILATHGSWDHYALTIMILKELLNTGIVSFVLHHEKEVHKKGTHVVENKTTSIFGTALSAFTPQPIPMKISQIQKPDFVLLYEYIRKMKEVILADPEKREIPVPMSKALKEMYQGVDKDSYLKTLQQLNSVLVTKPNLKKIKSIKTQETLQDILEEDQLYAQNAEQQQYVQIPVKKQGVQPAPKIVFRQ